MRRRCVIAALVVLACAPAPRALARAVNPRPQTIPAVRQWTGAAGYLRLGRASRIAVVSRSPRRLGAVARMLATELRAITRARVSVAFGEARPDADEIVLRLGSRDLRLGGEGYAMSIGRRVEISARAPAGLFYGTRTLLQLLRQYPALPRGRLLDWPRYPERGLMLDLGRRSYPVGWIESEIREMGYLKLNLLHLHLTDDQRWGIESDTHPEIVSAGALTKRQVREIIAFAARYHVQVVPEIDMPGHLGALLARHPALELKVLGTVSPPSTPESRKLDITNPAALAMVRTLLEEYMPLFPSRYWDMGADEYLAPADLPLYPQLATYALARYGVGATPKDTIIGFVNWVDAIVRAHRKTLRAWHDELGGGSRVTTNADVVVDWWINVSPLSEPRPPTPQELLSGGHRIANDGWFPTYYTGDLGPIQGMPSMRKAYESWSVNQFCGPTLGDMFLEPCYVIPAAERRNLGSSINVWDDRGLTLTQIATGLYARLRVIAQKTWNSTALTSSYTSFQGVMSAVGGAPH